MPKSKRAKRAIREQPHTLLIMAGLVLLLITVIALKSVYDSSTPATPLESELDRALAAKHPTFVLVNADGQVVWKQVESLSDKAPLDLDQAERQIEALTINP